MNADVKVTSEKLESHALVAEKNDRKEKYGKSNRNKGKRESYYCDLCGKKMDIQRIDVGICIHTSRLVQIKIRKTMLLLQIPQSQ